MPDKLISIGKRSFSVKLDSVRGVARIGVVRPDAVNGIGARVPTAIRLGEHVVVAGRHKQFRLDAADLMPAHQVVARPEPDRAVLPTGRQRAPRHIPADPPDLIGGPLQTVGHLNLIFRGSVTAACGHSLLCKRHRSHQAIPHYSKRQASIIFHHAAQKFPNHNILSQPQ